MNAKVLGILVLLLVLIGFLSYTAPESFLTGNNIENVGRRTAMFGILGIGVAFVIITGGIDLSIGSVVCLSGILLAMFLQVDYRPLDDQEVLAVSDAESAIYVGDNSGGYSVGDRVRFYQGIRAKTTIVTIEQIRDGQIELDEKEGPRGAVVFEVDQPFSRRDESGRISRIYNVLDADPGSGEEDPATVRVQGDHSHLKNRDQLHFIDEDGRRKREYEVASSRLEGEATVVTLKKSLDDSFSQSWTVTPVKRRQRMPIPLAIISVLAIGLGLGAVHGLLVTKLELPPFLVTLCGLLIYRGVSRWLVRDQVQGFGLEYSNSLSELASGSVPLFGEYVIPKAFLILLVVAVIAAVFLNRTIWGRYILALGNNEEAARYSGINTTRMTILAYVVCTTAAALGGMLFALADNSISPSAFGNLYELYAIAAAVLGGCSLRGGEGSVAGVVIGTALMQTLNNMIVLLKVSNELEYAIIGCVILIGVIADVLIKRLVLLQRAEQTQQLAAYRTTFVYTIVAQLLALMLIYFSDSFEDSASLMVTVGGFMLFGSALTFAVIGFLTARIAFGLPAALLTAVMALCPGLAILVAVGLMVFAKPRPTAAAAAGT